MKNTMTKMWRDENTHIWKNYNLFVVTSFEKIILHMWNDELFDVEVKKLQFFLDEWNYEEVIIWEFMKDHLSDVLNESWKIHASHKTRVIYSLRWGKVMMIGMPSAVLCHENSRIFILLKQLIFFLDCRFFFTCRG